MKKCSQCKLEKPVEDFYLHRISSKTGKQILFAACKECSKKKSTEQRRSWSEEKKQEVYKANRARYTERELKDQRIRYKFGLSIEEFEMMLIQQNHKCYICESELDIPQIDHCHKTNKVRKLLCKRCNLGIGSFDEDVTLLMKCIEYIKEHDNI